MTPLPDAIRLKRPCGNVRDMASIEVDAIRAALDHYRSADKAAAWLGISRMTVYRRAKEHNLNIYARDKNL